MVGLDGVVELAGVGGDERGGVVGDEAEAWPAATDWLKEWMSWFWTSLSMYGRSRRAASLE